MDSKERLQIQGYNLNLLRSVHQTQFSIRTYGCLRNDNIVYMGDLVQKTEQEMLRLPNFGRRSLNEVKEVLASMGLSLGMHIVGWPPENIEELADMGENELLSMDKLSTSAVDELPFDRILLKKLRNLPISTRTKYYLEKSETIYLGDLVMLNERQVRRLYGIGHVSIDEVKGLLSSMGLRFGMTIAGWPPKNIHDLARDVEDLS